MVLGPDPRRAAPPDIFAGGNRGKTAQNQKKNFNLKKIVKSRRACFRRPVTLVRYRCSFLLDTRETLLTPFPGSSRPPTCFGTHTHLQRSPRLHGRPDQLRKLYRSSSTHRACETLLTLLSGFGTHTCFGTRLI